MAGEMAKAYSSFERFFRKSMDVWKHWTGRSVTAWLGTWRCVRIMQIKEGETSITSATQLSRSHTFFQLSNTDVPLKIALL